MRSTVRRPVSTIVKLAIVCFLSFSAIPSHGETPAQLSRIVDELHQAREASGIGGGLADVAREKDFLRNAERDLQEPSLAGLNGSGGYRLQCGGALKNIRLAISGTEKGEPLPSIDEKIRLAIFQVQFAIEIVEEDNSGYVAGLPNELMYPYRSIQETRLAQDNSLPLKDGISWGLHALQHPKTAALSSAPDYPAHIQAASAAMQSIITESEKGGSEQTVDQLIQTALTEARACIDLYRKQPGSIAAASLPQPVPPSGTPDANLLKFSYLPDSSARLEQKGYQKNSFPAMTTDDPTDVIRGIPVYFDMHTSNTIHFAVESAKPLMKLIYTGVGFEKFTIEINDGSGKSVADAGPFDYGNKENTVEVPLPGIAQFEIVIRNESRDWTLIESLRFEYAGATSEPSTAPTASSQNLSNEQARAVVLISGDNAEGTGFLMRTADGPVVVTNLHVIANNPNLKITTNTGALITVLSAKGASDRDLALLSIQDVQYSYLEAATDISQIVQPGDQVITPGNSQGGEVILNTAGKVLGIGPERIEFDNPIYHGNSGGPIFHTKSGKVLGVVTEAMKIDTSDDLDKASFASRNSAIHGSMRYFGLRMDTVSAWVPIDSRRFQNETAFLDQFEKRSRALDAFLNAPDDDKPEDVLWKSDSKIVKANAEYSAQIAGSDTSQQLSALREFLGDLNDLANTDMDTIQSAPDFYSFDQQRAKDELAYRNALKAELESIGDNVSRLSSLPRTNTPSQ